ncbi:MAG TPA: hypothetical protein VLT33_35820 [Labilithrix sp.]|nr:hypothetical protein [Labilithrix sp.]
MGPFTRALRAFAPGMLMALPAAAAVWSASVRASWATLGRDQGIFQYIAWASARGDVLYRDVRDVNGPLVAMLHRLALALGGADEHRFRVLDLIVTGLAAAFAAGCLAALDERAKRGWERVLREISLGAAGWVILSAHYLAFGWWDTAQRESFFDWFVLVSIGLQITGQSLLRREARAPRAARLGLALLALAGAASAMPWFGKPTFVLFTLGQLAALVLDDLAIGRRRRVAVVSLGAALGAVVPLGFLLRYGDVRAWARITFVDVPAMYRFIWPRSFLEILRMPGHTSTAALAVASAAAVVALVLTKRMPRLALPLAVMPLAGLVSVGLQAKGFQYHFHPVIAGTTLVLVALAHQAWVLAERRALVLPTFAAGALAIALGARAAIVVRSEGYPAPPELRDRASLESEERLAQFERVDFFPKGLRDAAAHVASHTAEADRVQTYGMDPYLLFLAQRRSATPYIYAYDLDVDAALGGGFEDGARPTAEQRRVIAAMRDEHERDLLARLEADPPAAFVMLDRSPLLRFEDAAQDFEEHCPTAFAWVRSRYLESASFDGIHVWLRVPPPD